MSFNKGLARIGVNGLYDIELCDKDEMSFTERLNEWIVKYLHKGMHYEILRVSDNFCKDGGLYFILRDYPYAAKFAIIPDPKEGVNDRCKMKGVDMNWSDQRMERKYTHTLERCVKRATKHIEGMSDPIHGWGQP